MSCLKSGDHVISSLPADEIFGMPELPVARMMREKSELLAREVTRGTRKAVEQWAAQCKMTPENWLEFWRPEVTIEEPSELGVVRFTVKAKARDDLAVVHRRALTDDT